MAWRRLWGAAAVALLFGAPVLGLGVDAEPVALPAQVEPTVHAVRRCPHCGWIESKRRLELLGDARSLLSYEYTVRMADGSSRVFREELPTSWRVGERLLVIDGALN